MTALISNFSQYALLFDQPPEPARFDVSRLKVETAIGFSGEPVEITAEITNSGGTSGGYTATLTINGDEADKTELYLEAGSTDTVTFKFAAALPGEYTLNVNKASGKLIIKSPPEDVSPVKTLALPRLPPPSSLPEPVFILAPSPAATAVYLPDSVPSAVSWFFRVVFTGVLVMIIVAALLLIVRARSRY
jgi:hypothetical protein